MNALNKRLQSFSAFNDVSGEDDDDTVVLPSVPKALASEIKKALHDMQQKNNEALQSANDVVLTEHTERLNARIDELKDLAEENAKNIARATIGGPSDNPDPRRAQAARFFSRATGKRVMPKDADIAQYDAYCEAFRALVQNNFNLERLSADFRNTLSVGSDPDGGYLVTGEMDMEMEKRIYDTSPMRPIARVITIGGNFWEAPAKSSQGVSGGWVGEQAPRAATGTGAVKLQRIDTHEQYAYPEVTQAMLDDGAMDVESFVIDDTEETMVRTENTGFVTGNGVLKPRGFLDYGAASVTTDDATRAWGVLQYIASGAAGAFPKFSGTLADDGGCFIDAISKLNPAYRQGAVWGMSRATEATVRKLRDADGRYYVNYGDLQAGTAFGLHGFPIVNLEDMTAIASNSYSIAFGNFRRGYFIIDRAGFRMLKDPYTNKPYVGFYITKRVGGDVRNYDAIKLIKMAAS